jgi:hypothetical protein
MGELVFQELYFDSNNLLEIKKNFSWFNDERLLVLDILSSRFSPKRLINSHRAY